MGGHRRALPATAAAGSRLRRVLAAVLLTAVAGCSAAESGPPAVTTSGVSAPKAAPRAAAPSPVRVRVVMTGDVLLHDGLWAVAANDARKAGLPKGSLDFAPMFGPVRRLVAGADLAICHMETPLSARRGPFQGYPMFSVPPQVADGLKWTGFDACTTASNHSLDQGQAGLRRTLRVLDRAGIAHAGTARSPAERRAATIVDVKGVRVALLSYTYGTNGIPLDQSRRWSLNLIQPERIREDARRAKAAGADAVLVALHWGEEYQHQPSAYQIQVAREVTRSPDVDLVYGHHAHVVQPIRKVNGTWVAFGLGNFVAQQSTAVSGVYEGMAARFDIVRSAAGKVSVRYAGYRPTYISRYDAGDPAMRVFDIDAALENGKHTPLLDEQMAAARRRVVAVAGLRHR